jgi:voltage-gated potassium channel
VLALVQGREFVFLGGDAELFMLEVPSSLFGSTLRRADIGARTGLNVIGVRQGEDLVSPGPETALERGATMLAIGSSEQRSAFKRVFES